MSGEKEAYDELLGSISTTEDQGQDAPESLMDQALDGSKDNSDIIRKAHKNDIDEDDPVWILVKAYQDAADFQNQTAAMLDKIRCAAKDDARISIENAAHEAFASGTKALHRMLAKERVAMMSDIKKATSVKVQGGSRGMMSIMVATCVGVKNYIE